MKQAENMHAEIEVLYAENSMMACAHEAVRLGVLGMWGLLVGTLSPTTSLPCPCPDMARMRGEVSDMYTQLHRLYGYSGALKSSRP